MKIIKQGKSKEELEVILKAEKQFECKTCGCIFSATNDEYSYVWQRLKWYRDYIYAICYCKCPNCGRNAYQHKER